MNIGKLKITIWFLIAVIFLAGCARKVTPGPTPAVIPSSTSPSATETPAELIPTFENATLPVETIEPTVVEPSPGVPSTATQEPSATSAATIQTYPEPLSPTSTSEASPIPPTETATIEAYPAPPTPTTPVEETPTPEPPTDTPTTQPSPELLNPATATLADISLTQTFEAYPGPENPTPTVEATEGPTLNPYAGPTNEPFVPSSTPLPVPPTATTGAVAPTTTRSPTPGSKTPTSRLTATAAPGITLTPLPVITGTPTPRTTPTPSLSGTPTSRPISTSIPPQNLFQTVTIWHSWNATETQTLEDVIRAFQDIYPNVKFVLTYVPVDELQAQYERAAYLGNGPSLLLGQADWGPGYYDKGLIADLSSIADKQFLATINPAALNEATYRGALIGLPYAIRSGVVLYRNKTILPKAAGSFDELVALSKTATHGGTVGAYLEWSFFFSAAHLDGLGGQLMDRNGDPTFNSSVGVAWLNLLHAFKQAGPTEFNGNRDMEAFKAGKAGMIIDGTWNKNQLAQAIGLQNLAIDPWPTYQSGHLAGYLQTDNIYLDSDTSGDQRYAALQFMGFFLAREVQAIMTRAGHIPAVMDVKADDPLMVQEMAAFKGAVAYPIRREINAYWDPLQAATLSVVNGSADPVSALLQAYQDTKTRILKIRSGK